jgi:peptidyl-prolyl cis-trans isomerase C
MVSLLDKVPGRVTVKRSQAVRVNGTTITRAQIAQEVQNHAAETPADAWRDAARALAIRELLLQEARRTGLDAEAQSDGKGRRETQDEALIRTLIDTAVRVPEPTDAECRRIFETQPARFRTATLYEVRHILLPVRAAAEATARGIIADLTAAPERFDALARDLSACPSREVGGSLGQIGPGQTVPEFEAALAKLPVGQVAPTPVESRYGLHVVWVDRRIEGRPLPFDMARAEIAAWLSQRVYQTAIRQYISLLAGKAQIEGVEIAAAASPLLQ